MQQKALVKDLFYILFLWSGGENNNNKNNNKKQQQQQQHLFHVKAAVQNFIQAFTHRKLKALYKVK